MSNIPKVRAQLREIVGEIEQNADYYPPEWAAMGERLAALLPLLDRKPPSRPKAPPKSRPMTPERANAVRSMARRNPNLSIQEIAAYHKVNAGRVSEALSNV